MNKLSFRFFLSVTLLLTYVASAAEGGKYHVVKTFHLKGDAGWDYLTMDSKGKRIFVTRGTRVSVVNTDSGEEIGEVIGTQGVHGVALAPDLAKGFTSNGKSGTVTVFDLKSLKVLGTIPAGKKPDAIVYEPKSQRVLVFNGESKSVTIIDAVTNKVVGSLDLGGKPEFAAAETTGKIFVNIEDKNSIVAIDPVKRGKLAEWSIAPCEEPTGLSIDSEHHRLFAGCHNERLMVVSSDSGKVITSLPIGKGVDATAFDPGSSLIFSSNSEGTLTVIQQSSPDGYTVVDTATTQKSGRTMAVDSVTHRVYVIAGKFAEPTPASGEHRRPAMIPGTAALLVLER